MKWIIGDVHGCYDTLIALIESLPQEAKINNYENLIFVGDLVDRGKDSKKVIEFVRNSNASCVQGNHESMMIRAYEDFKDRIEFAEDWMNNGGLSTLNSYGSASDMAKDIQWMKSLPRYIIFEEEYNDKRLFVTHATCADMIGCEEENNSIKELMQWNRNYPRYGSDFYFNVSGHNILYHYINNHMFTIKDEDLESGVLIDLERDFACIDTGAFIDPKALEISEYVSKLSCLEFPSLKIYQQINCENMIKLIYNML